MRTLIAVAVALLAGSAGAEEAALRYVPLARPCRLYDSRDVVSSRLLRGVVYQIAMGCGLPLRAQAVQVTITIPSPPAAGHVVVWGTPDVIIPEGTSQMSFSKDVTSSVTLTAPLWSGLSYGWGGPSTYKAFTFLGYLPSGPEDGGGLYDALFDVSGYWVE